MYLLSSSSFNFVLILHVILYLHLWCLCNWNKLNLKPKNRITTMKEAESNQILNWMHIILNAQWYKKRWSISISLSLSYKVSDDREKEIEKNNWIWFSHLKSFSLSQCLTFGFLKPSQVIENVLYLIELNFFLDS